MAYNYKRFKPSVESSASEFVGLQVGDIVPNFKLLSLQGEEAQLFNNTNKVLVLESGSVTCPIYSGNITDMNSLATEYPDINFKVLYVREAHPGKKIHAHTDIEEKLSLANRVKDYFPENREILIDDLEGTAHNALALMPDSLLVIGTDRKVLYKLDWNNLETLKEVLSNIRAGKSVANVVPRHRKIPVRSILPVLHRAGPGALFDLLKAIPRMLFEKNIRPPSR